MTRYMRTLDFNSLSVCLCLPPSLYTFLCRRVYQSNQRFFKLSPCLLLSETVNTHMSKAYTNYWKYVYVDLIDKSCLSIWLIAVCSLPLPLSLAIALSILQTFPFSYFYINVSSITSHKLRKPVCNLPRPIIQSLYIYIKYFNVGIIFYTFPFIRVSFNT